MNALIEKITGMDKMSDQVIVTDFLVSSKSAIQNYAVAITETMSYQLRATLVNQLNDMIATHEAVSDYMIAKGYYYAYDLQEQFKVDMMVTDTALALKEFIL
ncbi:MAG TPA: spore coat protein [Lachnospiraceae bacterium]|nr:spore coat protein [Lachnospiraceae bacterium]